MGIINVLLIIIIALTAFLPIMLLIFIKNRERMSIIKQATIKDYIEEYMKKYTNCQLVEMDSKIKLDETQKKSETFVIGVCIFFGILIYSFKFIIRENLFIGYLICVFFVFGAIIIAFLTEKPTIKKIVLKNNIIELYDSNDEVKTYQLDQINIKYNIEGSYRYKQNKYINIYFNNDKYTSIAYNIYNFEPYIAFVIFVNLLKRNEIEKINNLNNDEIKILQQNFTYSEE